MTLVTIPELPDAPGVVPASDLLIVSHQGVTYRTTFAAFFAAQLTSPVTIPSPLTLTGFFAVSAEVVAAAGNSQVSATPLLAIRNIVNVAPAGSGVILPDVSNLAIESPVAIEISVLNRGGASVAVYPPTDQQIENLQPNFPAGVAPQGSARFLFSPEGLWRIT